MSGLDHHLWLRDGVYYVRMRLGSRQLVESLRTSDKAEARTLRTSVLKRWNRARYLDPEARLVALERPSIEKKEMVTIGRLLDVYKEISAERCRTRGAPRAATVVNNCSAFRRVFGDASRPVREALTVEALREYARIATAEAEDEMDMIRARVSASSNVAQALSVIAEWTEDEYRRRGIRLPAGVKDVRGADVVSAKMPQYAYTEERRKLQEETEKAAEALAGSNIRLYAIYLLAYMAGLRAGEIEASRWSWLRKDADGSCWIVVPRAEGAWRVKSKPGSVRLSPLVYEWLAGHRHAGEYILGDVCQERADALEAFSSWMRGVGWVRERFPKTTHELRKLAGVRWYSEHGAETAAKWLRDNLVTVLRFYADLDRRRQPEPSAPALMV